MSQLDIPQVAYLLTGLVIAGAAVAWAARRAKAVNAKGPGVFVSLLIWGGLIAVAMLLYQGASIWTWMLSRFQ